jgi:hypothetical protein
MKYAFLLWGDEAAEAAMSPSDSRRIIEEHSAFADEMRRAGRHVAGAGLLPSGKARIVRVAEGGLVTDGPFLEAKEQLGGLYLLECANEHEALETARRIPTSPGLVVEVRPAPY